MTPGRYTVLSVTDTGQGMSPETQAHIFEPFFTTKEVGKGTGLGLSMVYGTVKQTGGYIFVDSESGRGATFRMYFPPSTRTAAGAPVERPKRISSGPETLLVVEDEPAVRGLVTASLAADGFRILQAGSADEALRVAAEHAAIDLLLTDANMPGGAGSTSRVSSSPNGRASTWSSCPATQRSRSTSRGCTAGCVSCRSRSRRKSSGASFTKCCRAAMASNPEGNRKGRSAA